MLYAVVLGRASIDSSSFVGCVVIGAPQPIAYLPSRPLFQYFSWCCEQQMRAALQSDPDILFSSLYWKKSSISHTIVFMRWMADATDEITAVERWFVPRWKRACDAPSYTYIQNGNKFKKFHFDFSEWPRLTHNGKTWRPFEGGGEKKMLFIERFFFFCFLKVSSLCCCPVSLLFFFLYYLTKINLRGSSARVVTAPTGARARVCRWLSSPFFFSSK